MISITILGSGNVAQNLFEAFLAKDDVSIMQVVGRKRSSLSYFKGRVALATFHEELLLADVYIMAISDDAIGSVSSKLSLKGLLVHTSGAVPLSDIKNHERIGVFYPLQTFTVGKLLDFRNIPICIEANNAESFQLLKRLGHILSDTVANIDSNKRKALHLSAVFVNNFTNYMYIIGRDICVQNELQFSMLQPLIQETADKIRAMSPIDAQTGPAKRGDLKTLHAHLHLLKEKNQREIYTLLSNSIKARLQS
ncbi:Rossmann-like and DUF2520 domain-containing protein [Maribacter chungangensis]|uniref:Rossmann-like and DUF2520 domain-containing protein n=1 Tax=Maribacter chungangensis TaxID=1069117 RepID=A0ABW3B3E4_9FLAO